MAKLCSVEGCGKAYRARGLCSGHWKQEYGTPTRYAIVCEWCGAEHMSARKTGYACSYECRGAVDSYSIRGPLVSAVPRGHVVRELLKPERWPQCRVPYGTCERCGGVLIAVGGAKTCPGACRAAQGNDSRREAEQRRRARMRDAFVARVVRREVFARDAYMCKLCGEPLDMSKQAPHPLSPSIDHVIPLANGGTHEPGNVQAAHFLCNSVKSNKV